jgi:hypothetical protein
MDDYDSKMPGKRPGCSICNNLICEHLGEARHAPEEKRERFERIEDMTEKIYFGTVEEYEEAVEFYKKTRYLNEMEAKALDLMQYAMKKRNTDVDK